MKSLSLIAAIGGCLLGLTAPIFHQSPLREALAQSGPDSADPILAPPYHQGGAVPISPNETHPEPKRLASEVALALTNWSEGETPLDIAGRLAPLSGADQAPALAETLYMPQSASQGRVIYPQFGGLGSESASVMVVIEQMISAPEGVFVFVRTLDIRLAQEAGQWRYSRLASAGGDYATPPQLLSPEALAVLNDPRIELPDSARWDIYHGRIAPSLLSVMARMAQIAPYGIVTLISGHPVNIYGTERLSDHTLGRALDVYRVGEELVIDGRFEGSLTHQMVQWLYDQPEISKVGSPWALDGFGGRSFTDALHQDHLHIAVYP